MIIGINDHYSTPTVSNDLLVVVSSVLSAILVITIVVLAIALLAIVYLKNKVSIRKYQSSPASAAQQNTDKFKDKDVNYEEINELHTPTKIEMEVSQNVAYSTMILK